MLFGEQVLQYAMEYAAHGADNILAADHPALREYRVETYTDLLARWVKAFQPEILLGGATSSAASFSRGWPKGCTPA